MTNKLENGCMIYWHGKTWLIDSIAKNNTLVLLDAYSRTRFLHAFPSIDKVCFVATFNEWYNATIDITALNTRIDTIRASNLYERPNYQ